MESALFGGCGWVGAPGFEVEPTFPGGEVEELGVGGGLPCEDGSDGYEDEGGDPHANGTHGAFADRFFAYHAHYII